MNKKNEFINIVQTLVFDVLNNNYTDMFTDEQREAATAFWEEFKEGKVKNSSEITENGKKVLSWMQENIENTNNQFTSKEIAEGLFTSGRSIAGSMRKLVSDNYVEKIGQNPVQYSLTATGKAFKVDN